jgi:hypothetical protein
MSPASTGRSTASDQLEMLSYRASGLVQHSFRDLSAGCRIGKPLPAVNRSPVRIAFPAIQWTGASRDEADHTKITGWHGPKSAEKLVRSRLR